MERLISRKQGGVMRKLQQLFWLSLVVVTLVSGGYKLAQSRVTGTAPSNPDAVCFGRSGAEVCVDYSGNLVPTTANTQTIGSASLPFTSIAATSVIAADTSSSRLHAPYSTAITSTSLVASITTAGDIFLVRESGSAAAPLWAMCVSTGGINSVVFSSAPAKACRTDSN